MGGGIRGEDAESTVLGGAGVAGVVLLVPTLWGLRRGANTCMVMLRGDNPRPLAGVFGVGGARNPR